MILYILFAISVFFLIFTIFWMKKHKDTIVNNPLWSSLFALSISFTILFGFSVIFYTASIPEMLDDYQTDYDNLMVYFDTINESDNEYMRYHYYNDVKAYNNIIENIKENLNNSPWVGIFYPNDKVEELQYINFTLRGAD